MRRSSLIAVSALLVGSSSIAYGIAFHGEYAASIAGKDGSKIHGSATLKEGKDGKSTAIEVKLMGDAAGSVRPWHVHTGSCDKGGGVWGDGKAYTPLTADAKGNSAGTASITMAVPDSGSYYVNIHESSANMGKIVACGDLKKKM